MKADMEADMEADKEADMVMHLKNVRLDGMGRAWIVSEIV
jgi:hypothetical protein